jgi:LysR family transcriptional regulator of gallate degradation
MTPIDTAMAPPALPLRLVRVVLAVADAGSAAGAAERLHQSAPALTRAIQRAESTLGVPLFERGARGMVCTPAAVALLPRLRRAQQMLSQALPASRQRAASAATVFPGHLNDTMLQALLAVADTRSETAAARRLGLSQPSVHAALRQLEHTTRLRLFERSRRGTQFTQAGEVLLRQAKLMLAELRVGHEELAAFRGAARADVVVGALPMACDVLVSQAVARLLAAMPGARVTALDGTYDSLVHLLRHAEVDCFVGPLRGADAPADLAEEVLFVDRLVAVVGPEHPARAWRRPTLTMLARWPWIGPLAGTPAEAAFRRVFAAAGERAQVDLMTHSTAIVRSVLRCTDHVALLSPLQVRAELDDGVLCALPLRLAGSERAIGITVRRDGLLSSACARLLAELRVVAAAAVRSTRRSGHRSARGPGS